MIYSRRQTIKHPFKQSINLTSVHVISVIFVAIFFDSFSDSAGLDPIGQLLVDSSEGTVAFGYVVA